MICEKKSMSGISYSTIVKRGVPEANIQAEFYRFCRASGIRILLEVTHANCRFDGIVFWGEKPFAIIEIKNYRPRRAALGLNRCGSQMNKYSKYGLPIIGVLSARHIVSAFDKLLDMITQEEISRGQTYPFNIPNPQNQ